MNSIPRTAFKQALTAGVDAGVAAGMPKALADRLLALGDKASRIGRDYNDRPGCPLMRLRAFPREWANMTTKDLAAAGITWPAWANAFTDAYDTIVSLARRDPYDFGGILAITED